MIFEELQVENRSISNLKSTQLFYQTLNGVPDMYFLDYKKKYPVLHTNYQSTFFISGKCDAILLKMK